MDILAFHAIVTSVNVLTHLTRAVVATDRNVYALVEVYVAVHISGVNENGVTVLLFARVECAGDEFEYCVHFVLVGSTRCALTTRHIGVKRFRAFLPFPYSVLTRIELTVPGVKGNATHFAAQ